MSDVETCGNCGRSFRYMSFDRNSWAAFYCSEDCASTKGVISVDQSTARQYAEGVSPLTQVREYNDMSEHTKGPWKAARMVHADTGESMTEEQIGEYVKNTVFNSAYESGTMDFMIVQAQKEDGRADICHVGNGPTSKNNACLIAAAPEMYRLLEILEGDWEDGEVEDPYMADVRAALAKARGENQ